jgi:hypothetical protein
VFDPDLRAEGDVHIAVNDTIRALVVFARFPDGDDGVACSAAEWPEGSVVPAWADSVLEDADPPAVVGSMTHFFDMMSHGKHRIHGTYFPQVVVLDSTIVHYQTTYTSGGFDAILHANLDVTLEVAAAWDSLLADFDANGDGFLDHLHIVYRSTKSTAGPGWNLMATFDAVSYHTPFFGTDTTLVFSNGESIRIDDETGSCQRPIDSGGNRRSRRAVFDTFKHEYMHDIVESYGQPLNIGNVGHIASMASYGIMDGTYLGCGQFIDGFTLAELGWIEPVAIDSTTGGGDTTLVLSAVPDVAAYAIVRTADPNQYFVLELRNKDLPYAEAQGAAGCKNPAGFTGLLVTHVCLPGAIGWGFTNAPLFDPEVATGMFAADGSPDPSAGADTIQVNQNFWWTANSNDLYKPYNVDAFTPYSNPSTNLYDAVGPLYTPTQSTHSGISIVNVQWVGAGFDSIRVDVHFDGSAPPAAADTIRVDTTWQGLVQLTGDLVVAPGVAVSATAAADVILAAAEDRHAGGLDPARTEVIVPGSLAVTGSAMALPLVTSSRDDAFVHFRGPGEILPPAPGDWYGIRIPGGAADLDRADLRFARRAIEAGGTDSVSVDDCVISSFSERALQFAASDGVARHNVIVGTTALSLEGIAVVATDSPAYATLLANTISAVATGIRFVGPPPAGDLPPLGTTAIDSNVVAQAGIAWEQTGIAVENAGVVHDVRVRSNEIGAAAVAGIALRKCRGVRVEACNQIVGARTGILADLADRTCGITGNRVVSSLEYGVRVRGVSSNVLVAPVLGDVTSSLYPGENDIHGSGLFDVVAPAAASGSVRAQNNWWGTASPSPSQFSGPVVYTPWATQPFACDVQAAEPQGDARAAELEPALVGPIVLDLVTELALRAPHPNPFGMDGVRVVLEVPRRAGANGIDVSIHDVHGRRVRGLVREAAALPGRYEIVWDGRDAAGRRVANGVYFIRAKAADGVRACKVVARL